MRGHDDAGTGTNAHMPSRVPISVATSVEYAIAVIAAMLQPCVILLRRKHRAGGSPASDSDTVEP